MLIGHGFIHGAATTLPHNELSTIPRAKLWGLRPNSVTGFDFNTTEFTTGKISHREREIKNLTAGYKKGLKQRLYYLNELNLIEAQKGYISLAACNFRSLLESIDNYNDEAERDGIYLLCEPGSKEFND